jgi:hypothetical protein
VTATTQPPRVPPRIRRTAFAVAWVAIIVAMALGGAGIVAQFSHPPGTPARDELTWAGARAIAPGLDAAQADLEAIATAVDQLSVLGRGALGAMTADDQGPLHQALSDGTDTALEIQNQSATLRTNLEALPGDVAADAIRYGADALARRASMLAALEATSDLRTQWARLTAGAAQASDLIKLLTDHDVTVAAAAAEGRVANYSGALDVLGRATRMLDQASDIRDQLANASDVSTLDQWLSRNQRYDTALTNLYRALLDSGGKVNDAVRSAYQEESAARAILPPDTRGLTIIVADIGRGGLNQAVIAIEQAKGRLRLALEALAPPD